MPDATQPAPLPGPDDVTRHVLANGLTLLVRENWASPTVVARGVLRVGSADEAPEQGGLAQFTAALLPRGTAAHSFQAIAETTEAVGATLSVGSGMYLTHWGAKALAEDFPTIFDLLAEVLQTPVFPAEHVERVRGQLLNTIRQRDTNTRAVAYSTFCRLLYPPPHPLSRYVGGTQETVRGLSREDMQRFYATHYGPRGGILVIVGAIPTADAVALVERTLGGWPGAPGHSGTGHDFSALVTPPTEPRRATVALAGKTQSDLALGVPGLTSGHPDFIPMLLLNGILGQFGMGGRLGARVREENGLAYYARSTFEAGLNAGPWYAYAGVNPANLQRAVDLILGEMTRIRETPVSAEELADVQAHWTGALPLDVETAEGVAGELLDMELHSLGLDYLYRRPALIQAVTVDDIQAVARRWLDTERYALAVAGPP